MNQTTSTVSFQTDRDRDRWVGRYGLGGNRLNRTGQCFVRLIDGRTAKALGHAIRDKLLAVTAEVIK